MKPLIIDYETYYDKDVTLRGGKMTTPEYIMHPMFHVHMLAFDDTEDGSKGVVEGKHVKELLQDLHYEERAMIAHHAQFDGAITHWRYGLKAKMYVCTMQMAYAVIMNRLGAFDLDAVSRYYKGPGKITGVLADTKGVRHLSEEQFNALVFYATRDVEQCRFVFEQMRPHLPRQQFRVMDWHIRQFVHPILQTDGQMLRDAIEDDDMVMAAKYAAVGVTEKEIRKDQVFADMLTELGVEPPKEISPRTGKEKFAFSKQSKVFMDIAETHPDPRIKEVCELRILSKSTIRKARMNRMVGVHEAMGGSLPIYVKYSGAKTTHRPSGGDKVNHLNMPKKHAIRRSVCAPRGCTLHVSDLSGAELRICRTGVGDTTVMRMLASGADPYCDFAATVWGEPVVKGRSRQDDDRRFVGKICHLSLQYATGAAKLQHTCWNWGRVTIDTTTAKNAVHLFRRVRHIPVAAYWRYLEQEVFPMLAVGHEGELRGMPFIRIEDSGLTLPSGLRLDFPNLKQSRDKESGWMQWRRDKFMGKSKYPTPDFVYGGRILENISQSLTNEILAEKITMIEAAGIRVAHSCYDEVVSIVPPGREDFVRETVDGIMQLSPAWWPDLELDCESDIAYRYGDAK